MKIKTSKKLSNRLRPIFLTAFFDGFILWYAAEKLFMKSIGFSDQQIALNAVIYAVIIIAVNVPAGILADRWSRKGVLAISSLSLITGTLISGSSNAFWPYILGTAFWGLYFAIQSGIYESVIYDTLVEETGKPTDFEKYLGRVRLLMSAGLVAGSFASSLVVSLLNLRATYYLTIPFTVISLIALLRFREPTVHRQGERQHITAHASEMVRVLFSRVAVLQIALGMVFITALTQLTLEFDQLWLIALVMPLAIYGPVNALLLSSLGAGGLLAGRLTGQRGRIFAVLVLLACAAGLFMRWLPVVIISLTLLATITTALEIILNRLLQDSLPSRVRASAASVVGTVTSVLFIPLALLFGRISTARSVFSAAWIPFGLSLAITVICLVIFLRRPDGSLRSALATANINIPEALAVPTIPKQTS